MIEVRNAEGFGEDAARLTRQLLLLSFKDRIVTLLS
jgi:hypothetical protein